MPYELRTFGGLELLDPDGERIDAVRSHSKGAAVLVYLSTRSPGEAAPREELLPLLWPERAESPARNALRVTLSRLRDVLPEGALGGKGEDRLWLEGSLVTADVRAFEEAVEEGRFQDALELYRGPFLANFHLADGEPFNRWVDERRGMHRRQAYRAALSLGDRAREEGDPAAAESAYRRALELAPLKTEAATRLIRVLAERGQRTDALRLYEAFSRRLQDELDLTPSRELQELAESIRSRPRDGRSAASQGEGSGSATTAGEAGRERTPRDGARRPLRVATAVLLLVLVGVGVWYANRPDTSESAAARGTDRTIAVLPFEILGEERESDFAEGIHAGLLTRLASVSDVHVISGTSVRQYDGTGKTLPEIAGELGASWVLEGEVQGVGDEVQVNAQLVDARTDTHLWAESYRRDSLTARTAFQIQEELTRRIVEALEVELTPEDERQVASVPTENTAAYEIYLQAEEVRRSRRPASVARTERKIELYRRALALDSTFAEAWAGLADALADRATMLPDSLGWADSARRTARRSIELDPELADAHVQLGDAFWTVGQEDTAIDIYRKALELQPDHREAANNLSVLLGRRGELAEKARLLDRLVATSPRSSNVVVPLIAVNSELGREDVADAWRRYARDRGLSFPETEFDLALFNQGDVERARRYLNEMPGPEDGTRRARRQAALALYEGDWREARRRYRALYSGPGGTSHGIFQGLLDDRLGLAWALDRLGQGAEAREIAAQVAREAGGQVEEGSVSRAPQHRLAVARLLRGDTARTLDALESGVDAGFRGKGTLETVPTLAPLRDHPRFRALVARVDSLLVEERRRIEANGWAEPPGWTEPR